MEKRDDLIFALDIGTRTVIGVVGFYEEDKLKVVDIDVVEHKNRAMIDGQVHDVEGVANAAKTVKNNLEKRLGIVLKEVSIAAAGRSLKTSQVRVERVIDNKSEIDINTIGSLEIAGVQSAQMQFEEEKSEDEDITYYCVGYTVINYYINNYIISSLLGHKGKTIGADVLATFLPHTVIDSLYSVMSRAGLRVISLTLEPIAAINIAIPNNIRLLNLALVDIGAGTSDIALTQNGSVVAYAMVPIAGDEITEIICQNYLLDFNTAEIVKIAINGTEDEVSFIDIFGVVHTERVEILKELIGAGVKKLADTITDKIIEYNKKAPSAVFLVGGGSQVWGLSHAIAENLKLPMERVAVRKIDALQNIEMENKKAAGPEYITPLGIALNSLEKYGQDFLSATVNGKKVRLFNVRQQTVADALLLADVKPEELIPKKGKNLNFSLNGEVKIISGEYGQPAEVYVNGKLGSIQTVLSLGDDIMIKPAGPGYNAAICIKDIIEYYNGENIEVIVNSQISNLNYSVNEGDLVEIKVMAEKRSEDKTLDEILIEEVENNNSINQVAMEIEDKIEEKVNSINIVINGEIVSIEGNQPNFIFIDVFNYIKIDIKNRQGNIVLRLNGNRAAYTDIIKENDVIDIYWE